jgi:hypothetical protein
MKSAILRSAIGEIAQPIGVVQAFADRPITPSPIPLTTS